MTSSPISSNGNSSINPKLDISISNTKSNSVNIKLKDFNLQGRLYQGVKNQDYFTTRPIRYLFLVEFTKVNVKVDGVASQVLVKTKDGVASQVLVKTSDLKKALGVSSKQLKALQKKGDGSLQALIKNKTDKPKPSVRNSSLRGFISNNELEKVKQIRRENKNRLKEGQIARKQDKSYITIKTGTGKVKVFKNLSEELGKGSFKTVTLFAKVSKTSIKKIAYAEVKPVENRRKLKKNIAEAKEEFLLGKKLYDGYRAENGKEAVPFVKYYQAMDISQSTTDSQSFGMLMEHCDTNLRNAKLSPTEKGDVFLGILQGVAYMNNAGIVHRDLKRDNIMVKYVRDEDGQIIGHQPKIIDFGLSSPADEIKDLYSFAGTRNYSAPEAFIPKRFQGDATKLDSWSLGVILYKMHFDSDPDFKTKIDGMKSEDFTSENNLRIVNKMAQFHLDEGQGPVVAAISGLLNMDPTERWSAQDALEFLTQAKWENDDGKLQIGFN